jgi:membrane-associated phospholipid phosphatase
MIVGEVMDRVFGFMRVFPLVAVIFPLLEGLFLSDPRGLELGIMVFVTEIFNHLLKLATSQFIGKEGDRPPGAHHCGYGVAQGKKAPKSGSYGMPSGHAQTAAFVATLMALAMRKQNMKRPVEYYDWKLAGLLLFVVTMMYARVVIEKCHTWIQTLVGVAIGIVLAFIFSNYISNPFSNVFGKKKRRRKKRKSISRSY